MTSKENIHLVTSTRTWQVVGEWRGERGGEGGKRRKKFMQSGISTSVSKTHKRLQACSPSLGEAGRCAAGG